MTTITNDIKQLIKNGFMHIFGGTLLTKVISFLSSIVLVRIISKPEYGVFTYAWNIYSFVILLNGLGINSGVLQLCSEKNDSFYRERITRYGVRFGIVFDIVLVVIIMMISFFAPLKIKESKSLLLMLSGLPLLRLIYDIGLSVLRYSKKNQEYAYITVTNSVVALLFAIIGAKLWQSKGLVASYYVTYIITISILLYKKYFSIGHGKYSTIQVSEKKSLLRISVVSMANTGISQLLFLLDVFVIGFILANEEIVATYRVATIIPSALIFIPMSIAIFVYPYFAEHQGDQLWCRDNFKKMISITAVMNAIISITLVLLAPVIIEILFGEKYMDSVPVFKLLSANYFITGTFREIQGNILVSQRKLRFNFIVAIVSGAFNVIADIFLVSKYGIIGAAFATTLVSLISGVMNTVYLVKLFYGKDNYHEL